MIETSPKKGTPYHISQRFSGSLRRSILMLVIVSFEAAGIWANVSPVHFHEYPVILVDENTPSTQDISALKDYACTPVMPS